MSYNCETCGFTLAGMETCDCPVGRQARAEVLARWDALWDKQGAVVGYWENHPEEFAYMQQYGYAAWEAKYRAKTPLHPDVLVLENLFRLEDPRKEADAK